MILTDFLTKHRNEKIVFTNGCFDVIHRGHISYLNKAKQHGDLLIIGINSDASVKRLKGPSRPINNEADRKFLLENLKAVDFVEIFEQDTPLELIKLIKPQVLIKGGDWKIDDIIGKDEVIDYGGDVLVIPFVKGYSSTSLISKIKTS